MEAHHSRSSTCKMNFWSSLFRPLIRSAEEKTTRSVILSQICYSVIVGRVPGVRRLAIVLPHALALSILPTHCPFRFSNSRLWVFALTLFIYNSFPTIPTLLYHYSPPRPQYDDFIPHPLPNAMPTIVSPLPRPVSFHRDSSSMQLMPSLPYPFQVVRSSEAFAGLTDTRLYRIQPRHDAS